MARPKGSRNKPKDVPTASGAVETDHNVIRPGELTDDQKQALFWQHKKSYEEALETKRAADAALKNVCKLIKSEGTKLADIKLAMMAPDAFEAHVRAGAEDMIRMARWLGSPLGTQFALFDTPDRTSSDEKAFADGKRAGLAGQDASPPYAKHLPQAGRWLEGWHAGQDVVLKGFKPTPEPDEFDDLEPVEVPPVAASALDEMAREY